MQAITSRPPAIAAATRRATDSSDSPKYWRRSECPTSVPVTPSSGASRPRPRRCRRPRRPSARSARRRSGPASRRRPRANVRRADDDVHAFPGGSNAAQNARVSAGVLNIFQLAAISTAGSYAAGIAATPGSSLPSSSSSAAPPPVETHETARPGRARSARAPSRRRPRPSMPARRDRLGHRLRSLGEPRPLEDAHRPVPEDRPGAVTKCAKRSRVSGPMSRPSQPSGTSS